MSTQLLIMGSATNPPVGQSGRTAVSPHGVSQKRKIGDQGIPPPVTCARTLVEGEVAINYAAGCTPMQVTTLPTHRIALTDNQEVIICANGNVRVRVADTVFEVTPTQIRAHKQRYLIVDGRVSERGTVKYPMRT